MRARGMRLLCRRRRGRIVDEHGRMPCALFDGGVGELMCGYRRRGRDAGAGHECEGAEF